MESKFKELKELKNKNYEDQIDEDLMAEFEYNYKNDEDLIDEFEDSYKEDLKPIKRSDIKIKETERIVLSLILKNKVLPEYITEKTFTDMTYKEVVKGIRHFSDQNQERKFETKAVGILLSRRRRSDKWKDEIIPEILSETIDKDLEIENFISILREEQLTLKALEIAKNIVENVNSGHIDYLKKAASELNDIEVYEASNYDTLSEALDLSIFEMDQKIASDSKNSGVTTGIPTLDETTGGLQKSDLIILAARPGQGKTATAINLAYNSNESCGFISSEMPSSQLASRLLSLDSGVNAQKIRNPKTLNNEELNKIRESSIYLKNNKELYITDKPAISIQEVREIAKKWKEKYDIKVLFIDYLQRLSYKAPGFEKMPRNERIGMIAQEAKEIARELDIAVVGLAQINRASEKNEATGGQPMLSDLGDSGMLEREADLVICPWRQNTSGMDVNAETEMIILILKNRHGPLGEIPVLWIPRNMKIVERDNYSYNDPENQNTKEEITEEEITEMHF